MHANKPRRWLLDLTLVLGLAAMWALYQFPLAGRALDIGVMVVATSMFWLMHRWVRANAAALDREERERCTAWLAALEAPPAAHQPARTAVQDHYLAVMQPLQEETSHA